MNRVNFVNIPLLAASALVFICILSGLFSTRFGFSFLLVFLLAGILAGEDGPGGLRFSDFTLSFWVGNVALAVILLDGGLRTSYTTFRTGLKPALALATVGVAVSAAVAGVAASVLLDLPWQLGVLLGAVVGSTDAAAVFALLKKSGVTLSERLASTLEIESGMNDPMAVYLTLLFIGLALGVTTSGSAEMGKAAAAGAAVTMGSAAAWIDAVLSFARQFGLGIVVGAGAGVTLAALLNRLPASDAGITALLVVSAGMAVFAGTGWLDGSGFLAVYLFGMVLGNRARDRVATALSAMDGYAWLSQAAMFLLLGLLATPAGVFPVALPALGVSAVLILVARPLAVWLCLAPLKFSLREICFISWVGLRGAVPIVLAVFPLMAGVPQAMVVFNVAFVVVLCSLLLQGMTIGPAARWLGVALPDADDVRRARLLFGDFVLDSDAPIGAVCEVYGLPLPVPVSPQLPLASWLAARIRRPPVVGDAVRLGVATLVVREMQGPQIAKVGLRLPLPISLPAPG